MITVDTPAGLFGPLFAAVDVETRAHRIRNRLQNSQIDLFQDMARLRGIVYACYYGHWQPGVEAGDQQANVANPVHQQIGFKGFQSSLQWEAAQWSQILPALPRLLHQSLTQSNGRVDHQIEQLVKQQKRLNKVLFWMVLSLAVLFGLVALELLWPMLMFHWGPVGRI